MNNLKTKMRNPVKDSWEIGLVYGALTLFQKAQGLGILLRSRENEDHLICLRFGIPTWRNIKVIAEELNSINEMTADRLLAVYAFARELKGFNEVQDLSTVGDYIKARLQKKCILRPDTTPLLENSLDSLYSSEDASSLSSSSTSSVFDKGLEVLMPRRKGYIYLTTPSPVTGRAISIEWREKIFSPSIPSRGKDENDIKYEHEPELPPPPTDEYIRSSEYPRSSKLNSVPADLGVIDSRSVVMSSSENTSTVSTKTKDGVQKNAQKSILSDICVYDELVTFLDNFLAIDGNKVILDTENSFRSDKDAVLLFKGVKNMKGLPANAVGISLSALDNLSKRLGVSTASTLLKLKEEGVLYTENDSAVVSVYTHYKTKTLDNMVIVTNDGFFNRIKSLRRKRNATKTKKKPLPNPVNPDNTDKVLTTDSPKKQSQFDEGLDRGIEALDNRYLTPFIRDKDTNDFSDDLLD